MATWHFNSEISLNFIHESTVFAMTTFLSLANGFVFSRSVLQIVEQQHLVRQAGEVIKEAARKLVTESIDRGRVFASRSGGMESK